MILLVARGSMHALVYHRCYQWHHVISAICIQRALGTHRFCNDARLQIKHTAIKSNSLKRDEIKALVQIGATGLLSSRSALETRTDIRLQEMRYLSPLEWYCVLRCAREVGRLG